MTLFVRLSKAHSAEEVHSSHTRGRSHWPSEPDSRAALGPGESQHFGESSKAPPFFSPTCNSFRHHKGARAVITNEQTLSLAKHQTLILQTKLGQTGTEYNLLQTVAINKTHPLTTSLLEVKTQPSYFWLEHQQCFSLGC